ncbi:hypothetical protein, conserved [Eimeria brunetti]|uniref:Uncharacterized protein n=1 Tax=Eimeria brunetti TaxID=51314 RepID=U6LI81_9EIME|nr:hypothetical protein, conserved [Eimeria brunetti]
MASLFSAKWAWVALKFILKRREELKNIRKKGFVVVVIGCTNGLGAAVVRAVSDRLSTIESHTPHTVIMTTKKEEEGKLCLEKLRHPTVRVGFHPLDATSQESIAIFSQKLKNEFQNIDILIHSMLPTAVQLGYHDTTDNVVKMDYYETKTITLALLPLMALGGRIVIGASSLAEMAIRWMNEGAFIRLFRETSTVKDLDGIADKFVEEKLTAGPGGRRVYDSMAYPFAQAARIALAQCMGNVMKISFPDPSTRITVCSFAPGWCRTPTEGHRAPFSALEGAEEAVFAAFDAKAEDIQGAYIIGRRPARFGVAVAAIESENKASMEIAILKKEKEKEYVETMIKQLVKKFPLAIEDGNPETCSTVDAAK